MVADINQIHWVASQALQHSCDCEHTTRDVLVSSVRVTLCHGNVSLTAGFCVRGIQRLLSPLAPTKYQKCLISPLFVWISFPTNNLGMLFSYHFLLVFLEPIWIIMAVAEVYISETLRVAPFQHSPQDTALEMFWYVKNGRDRISNNQITER